MLTAVALIVGAVAAWVAGDLGWSWLKERRNRGASWHGRGPGATFHSTGFEDTVPPHEVVRRAGLSSGRRA